MVDVAQQGVGNLYSQIRCIDEILKDPEHSKDSYLLGIRDGYQEALRACEAEAFTTLAKLSDEIWQLAGTINGNERKYLCGKSESLMRAAIVLGVG